MAGRWVPLLRGAREVRIVAGWHLLITPPTAQKQIQAHPPEAQQPQQQNIQGAPITGQELQGGLPTGQVLQGHLISGAPPAAQSIGASGTMAPSPPTE
jgi:hypothetical protein